MLPVVDLEGEQASKKYSKEKNREKSSRIVKEAPGRQLHEDSA
jgi:hypothetical protein